MKSAGFDMLPLHLLKTFCVFAETGRVEEAARRLQITQASVSLQLKKFEEETGQILFRTVGRKKMLTSFARDLFQSIAPPLIELEHRLKEVSKIQIPLHQRTLRIGCRFELIKRLTPLIVFPGQVHISEMTSDQALSALKSDEIDIAVVPEPQIKGSWYTKKIFTDTPVLIANPKILKSKSLHSVYNLFKHTAVSYKEPDPYIKLLVENFGGKLSHLKVKLYCQDWLSIIDVVKNSMSWSILPRHFGDDIKGLTCISLPQELFAQSNIYSVSSKEWRGTPIFQSAN